MTAKNKTFDYDPLEGDVSNFQKTETATTQTEPAVPVAPTVKRGRGRPPKYPKTVETATATETDTVTDMTTKDPVKLLLNFLGSQVVTITPSFAKHVLTHCNKLNRRLNKKWIKFLAEAIKRGEWQLNGEPLIFSTEYDLIDGQHRLHAIVAANKELDTYVTTNIDPKTFVSVDSGHSRSGSHVLAINSKIKHSFDVSAALNKLNRYNNKNYDFDGASVISNRQLVTLLHKHKHITNSVEMARKFPKGYSKSTIAFCHYVLDAIDHDLTTKFFEQLAMTTPTIPLIAALRKGTVKEGRSKSRIKQTVVIGSIFKTWNAMRTNDANATPVMSATEEFPIPQ